MSLFRKHKSNDNQPFFTQPLSLLQRLFGVDSNNKDFIFLKENYRLDNFNPCLSGSLGISVTK